MISFQIKLAGIPIQVHAIYSYSMQFCQCYLTEEAPYFTVTMTQQDIEEERIRSCRTCIQEKREVIDYSNAYLETLALYRKITAELIRFNILLFHGSVIAVQDQSYLFTAKSGVGKTTHTQLWLKNIPDCHVLNGDKPLIAFYNDGIYACGTPWQGKENLGTNEVLPLKAICILERSTKNQLEQLSFKTAFSTLMTQSYHPNGSKALMQSIDLIKQFERIKLYRLKCNMNDEAALVSYKGMVEFA